MWTTFLVHHSFLKLRSSIWDHFPFAWVYHLEFLLERVSWCIFFQVLCIWKEFYLPLFLKFCWIWNSRLTIIFSHHFEDIISLPSGSTVVIDKSALSLLSFEAIFQDILVVFGVVYIHCDMSNVDFYSFFLEFWGAS